MNVDSVALSVRPRAPGPFTASLRVLLVAPFQVLRGRRLLALVLLVSTPVLVGSILRANDVAGGLGVRGFVDLTTMFYLAVIFPVTNLFLGAAAIGDELENGTLLYYRLRPISRSSIVIGRYLVAALSAAVLLVPSLIIFYLIVVGWRGVDAIMESLPLLLVAVGTALLASLAYGALFLLLSLIFKRAVIIGLFFVVGWEVLVSTVIPSQAAILSVSFHLRSICWHATSEGKALPEIMEKFESVDLIPAVWASVLGLLLASVLMVALSCFVFRRKEYSEVPGDS